MEGCEYSKNVCHQEEHIKLKDKDNVEQTRTDVDAFVCCYGCWDWSGFCDCFESCDCSECCDCSGICDCFVSSCCILEACLGCFCD